VAQETFTIDQAMTEDQIKQVDSLMRNNAPDPHKAIVKILEEDDSLWKEKFDVNYLAYAIEFVYTQFGYGC